LPVCSCFLPCRSKWVFPQGTDALDRASNELFQLRGRIDLGEVHQLGSFRWKSDFRQQPPDRTDADLRPVIALRQMTVPLGARHHAKAPGAAFHRMQQILPIHLAAAGDFPHEDPGAVLIPLTRQIHSLRDAVGAEVDDHVWGEGFRHKGTGLVQDLRIPFLIGVCFVIKNKD
jgi:hypothetical protein